MSLLFPDRSKVEVDAAIKVEEDLDRGKKWSIRLTRRAYLARKLSL